MRLPAVEEALSLAYVSHVAVPPDRPDVLRALFRAARHHAARRGIEMLAVGLAANDPRLACVPRAFGATRYDSRLYLVSWDDRHPAAHLGGRILHPEVALL